MKKFNKLHCIFDLLHLREPSAQTDLGDLIPISERK